MSQVKVRFPPSPTGLLHVGSARTALYNWLYARHVGGRLVLRFEDTDRERSTDAAIDQALRVLEWLGIDWDEGPHRQTQRLDRYAEVAESLIAADHAYRCDCTTAQLDAERADAQRAGRAYVYSGRCRHRNLPPGSRTAIRLVVPAEGETVIEDVVRGTVRWDNALVGDHVIVRSDGTPTYQFANPVDDIDQGVTHVVRGEDLLSSTPRQLALYAALRAPEPVWAHLPMILGPDKKKLSKRHGAVSVEEFRDRGYLPDALRNYLALLGWSFDDHTTVMTTPQLVERFTLERVNKSPAVFDFQKLEWLNGEHLRMLTPGAYTAALRDHLAFRGSPLATQPERVAEVAPLVQEKLRELGQFDEFAGFLFGPVELDAEAWRKVVDDPDAARALAAARARLEQVDGWTTDAIEQALRDACQDTDLKPRVLFTPVRVALCGRTVAPGLFESLEVLGRAESLGRISIAERNLATG